MKLKVILAFIVTLCSSALLAQNYQYTGVVIEQSADAATISIDNIEYRIDYETRLHNSLQKPGETAPKFDVGETIGFNIQQVPGVLPKITDIWVLGN